MSTQSLEIGCLASNVISYIDSETEQTKYFGASLNHVEWSNHSDLFQTMKTSDIEDYISRKINESAFLVSSDVEIKSLEGETKHVFTIMRKSEMQCLSPRASFQLLSGPIMPSLNKVVGIYQHKGGTTFIFVDRRCLNHTVLISAIGMARLLPTGSYDPERDSINQFNVQRFSKAKIVLLEPSQYKQMKLKLNSASATPTFSSIESSKERPESERPRNSRQSRYSLFRSSRRPETREITIQEIENAIDESITKRRVSTKGTTIFGRLKRRLSKETITLPDA